MSNRAFTTKDAEKSMQNFNLIEPLYINVAINLNSDFNPAFKEEFFKYQVVVLVSKVILTVTPEAVKDIK